MSCNAELLEKAMWEYAAARDSAGFSSLVSADAVMVCGGYRCTGAQYAEIISQFDIDSYEISGFETVASDEDTVQIHYVINIVSQGAPDLAGRFHVTSTWQRHEDNWKLIFNMDSLIR